MCFNLFFKKFFSRTLWKRTLLFTLAGLFFTNCGLKVGEPPWFSENQIYDLALPSPEQCKSVKYKKIFADFFTKDNGKASSLLDSMETAVLCLKRKVTEYSKLVRGDHAEYLTQPELKNLLNHKVVKTGIEGAIDKITSEENFNVFIGVKNIILKIHDSSQTKKTTREISNQNQQSSLQSDLFEAFCSTEPKRVALYKKEVDELSEFLDVMKQWLQSVHVSSERLALQLNSYVGSEEFVRFFQEEFPDRSLKEIIEYLVQKNLNELDVDLRRKYFSARRNQIMRERRFVPTPVPLNHPVMNVSRSGKSGSLQSEETLTNKDGPATEEEKGFKTAVSLPTEFFQYLQEHPKALLSIPEIHQAALLSVLTDTADKIGLPGFSWYFAEKQQKISKLEKERENRKWYEELWPFGSSDGEEERDEMLSDLYAMTKISRQVTPHPSHITGLDMKYLLLNAHIVEKVMDIYDFNKNGFVERKELESMYCLFDFLLPPVSERNTSQENGMWKRWMQDIADYAVKQADINSEKIFNYILKYQEIPSTDDSSMHLLWVSYTGDLDDADAGEIVLSREDMVKLVSALFHKFFPEKYFMNKEPSVPSPPVDEFL